MSFVRLAGKLLSLLFLVVCTAPAQAENIAPITVYVSWYDQYWVVPIGDYDNGDEPCRLIATALNARQSDTSFGNPRYGTKPQFGTGCYFDETDLSTGTTAYNQFNQNQVVPEPRCLKGFSYSSNGGYCSRSNAVANKPCPQCSPNADVGNPISSGSGAKVERVSEVLTSSLTHNRAFLSYNTLGTTTARHMLGKGWHSDLTRQLSYAPGNANAPATAYVRRGDGTSVIFTKPASDWVAEADLVGYKLRQPDANSWELETPDHRVEFYDVRGLLTHETQDGVMHASYQRDALGRIDALVDRKGRATQVVYRTDGLVDRFDLSDGTSIQFAFDGSGRLSSVTRGGMTTVYGYTAISGEADTYLSSVSHDGTSYAAFGYDTSGRATSTEHAGGVDRHVVTYPTATSSSVQTPLGGTIDFQYVLSLGNKLPTSRQESGAGASTSSTTYGYDGNGNTVSVRHNGVLTCHYYDGGTTLRRGSYTFSAATVSCPPSLSAAASSTYLRGHQTAWAAGLSKPTERTTYDVAGAVFAKQAWTYNARGQALATSQIDPATSATRTHTTTYCEQPAIDAGTCPLLGLVTQVDGPRTDVSDITTYTYYPSDDATCATAPTTCPYRKGDLWKVTNALGQVTEMLRYDGAGRTLMVMDANGVVTDMEYHPRGWLTARKVRGLNDASETDDQITRIDYYPTGLVQKTTLPDGSYTAYTYDAAHRLTDITDGEGNKIHYTLDNAGNRTQEDTLGHTGDVLRTLSRVYNQLGQMQTQKDAYDHATGFAYDANGNTETVTDALSRVTDNDYDPLDRLTQTIQNVGGLNVTTQFQYDARDNLTAVVDPKNLTTGYTYNGLGDLTQLSSPDTGVTSTTYDSAGNRQTQTDARGVTTTYTYDSLNRLTNISYPDSSLNQDYYYDAPIVTCPAAEQFHQGRLGKVRTTSGSIILRYCYDRFGNVTQRVQNSGGKVFTQYYTYTQGGQLSSTRYSDGTLVDYVRDALGRVTEVGVARAGSGIREVLLHTATYYPFGPAAEWTWGNGLLFRRSLNQNYQPGFIEGIGVSFGYEFDAVGNLYKQRNATQSDPPNRVYSYDPLNRLAEVRDGAGTLRENYGYDATGNRSSVTDNGVTQAYSYPATSHRLDAIGSIGRNYDAVGNTTAINGTEREFVYNDAGRMSQVKRNGAVAMNYQYNGKGEQVYRSLGTTAVHTVYDEAGHWLGEYDTAGAPLQQVIWLDDLPVGVIAGNKLHYIAADALGSPRAVYDPQRSKELWRWALGGEAFGVDVPGEDMDADGVPFVFNLRFPGQRYDAATGLNYNYFRDYEAGTGRYVESDPIGLGGGVNTYLYVGGAPASGVDPLGLQRGATTTLPGVGPPPAISGNDLSGSDLSGANPSGGLSLTDLWCGLVGCNAPSTAQQSSNVIPFPKAKAKAEEKTCPPDGSDNCPEVRENIMSVRSNIEVMRIIQEESPGRIVATMQMWNHAAANYNRICVPRGHPPIDQMFFFPIGPQR